MDAKARLNQEIDILEIVKKLRVAFFASEIALKPRQRKLVGFFDDFKLKTPDESLAEKIKVRNELQNEERMSMTGIRGEEYGNLDDLIDKDKHEVERVIKAVNRVRADEDPIDAISHDRITNVDKTDGFMWRSGYMRAKGVNMDRFIESMSAFNRRFSMNANPFDNQSGPSN